MLHGVFVKAHYGGLLAVVCLEVIENVLSVKSFVSVTMHHVDRGSKARVQEIPP